jgi:hypothetical protein
LQPPLDADTEERLDVLKAALEVVDLAALPDLIRLRHDGGLDREQRVVDSGVAASCSVPASVRSASRSLVSSTSTFSRRPRSSSASSTTSGSAAAFIRSSSGTNRRPRLAPPAYLVSICSRERRGR